MVGIPLLQLILFGYAINSDPKHLPTAILDNDRSAFSRDMMELSGLLAAAGFRVAYAAAPRVRTRSGKDVRGVVLAAVTF